MEALPLGVGPQTLGGLPWQRRSETHLGGVTLCTPLSHTAGHFKAGFPL